MTAAIASPSASCENTLVFGRPNSAYYGDPTVFEVINYAGGIEHAMTQSFSEGGSTPTDAWSHGYASPIIVDLDADGELDALSWSNGSVHRGTLYAMGLVSGEIPDGFPFRMDNAGTVMPPGATPAIGDLDGDGALELVTLTNEMLWAFRLPEGATASWPMFQRDLRNSGALPATACH